MRDENIGFFRKIALKILTKLQLEALKQRELSGYALFTKMHFKLYFRDSLEKNSLHNTKEYKAAKHRHGCMAISLLSKDSKNKNKLFESYKQQFDFIVLT